ncbi:MAG: hypothetical protein J3Q66DRAFT_385909 [Benniella sp.]|nr:MAG: hypothetical protein J3Q66DRAFT_385909 [Benniella sp.]
MRRHWSEFLDLNLLRPSSFERRHLQEQAYQRPASTSGSLSPTPSPSSPTPPTSLPSRTSSFTFPVTGSSSHRPSTSSSPQQQQQHTRGRLSLDVRRSTTITTTHPSSSTLSPPLPLQRTRSHHDSPCAPHLSVTTTTLPTFLRGQFLAPPSSSSTNSTLSRSASSQSAQRRGVSLDAGRATTPTPTTQQQQQSSVWGAITGDRISLARPIFFRGRSWSGNAPPERTTTIIVSSHEQDENEQDQAQAQAQEPSLTSTFALPRRPCTGLDMTPRTSRTRRPVIDEDDDEAVATAATAAAVPLDDAGRSTHEVIIVVPSSESTESEPTPSGPDSAPASLSISTSASALALASASAPVSASLSTPAPISASASAPTSARPTSTSTLPSITVLPDTSSIGVPERTLMLSPLPLALPRPSTADSSRVDVVVPIPPSRAQLKIIHQMSYLRKFMCVIATLPIIATLAVHNRLEIVMWWVIVLPLLGISIAMYWRWRLGKKLQRLQEDAQASRLSLSRQLSTPSPQPPLQHQGDPEDASPPPPDYQSSIITPPAYITAQQPRKIPSYRSLEHLFAFARRSTTSLTGGRASGGAAGGAAGAAAASGGENGEAAGREASSSPPQDPSSPRDPQEQEGAIEHPIPTSSHDQVVGALEEELLQQQQLDLSDYHGSNDPSPHHAAASSSHIVIAMGDTPEMTERTGKDSGFRKQAFRLCSGLIEDSLTFDVEAGSSGGGHTLPSASSGHAAISSRSTNTHKDIPNLDLSDHPTSDVEERSPRQTTMRDVKGKAPCRE